MNRRTLIARVIVAAIAAVVIAVGIAAESAIADFSSVGQLALIVLILAGAWIGERIWNSGQPPRPRRPRRRFR